MSVARTADKFLAILLRDLRTAARYRTGFAITFLLCLARQRAAAHDCELHLHFTHAAQNPRPKTQDLRTR